MTYRRSPGDIKRVAFDRWEVIGHPCPPGVLLGNFWEAFYWRETGAYRRIDQDSHERRKRQCNIYLVEFLQDDLLQTLGIVFPSRLLKHLLVFCSFRLGSCTRLIGLCLGSLRDPETIQDFLESFFEGRTLREEDFIIEGGDEQ